MTELPRYPLHRPEIYDSLAQGERKIEGLMSAEDLMLSAGSTLITAGEDHRFAYQLRRGWVGRSRLLPDGRNQFILVFLPGDLFAVKSLFMSQHPDDVRAISDVVVRRVAIRDLYDAFIHDGDVATRAIWQVMEEERRLHSWVVSLGQGSAEERVAALLVGFRGRLVVSEAIPFGSLRYDIPMSQVQLADYLGITPVHVSRVLSSLRSRGIVSVQVGEVQILNLDALATLAAPLLDPYESGSPAYVGTAAPDLGQAP